MNSLSRFVLRSAACVVFAPALALNTLGQQQSPRPGGTTDAENSRREAERRAMEREKRDRQFTLRSVESEAGRRPDEPAEPRLDLPQILEDFKLLQVVSHDLVQTSSTAEALDLKSVAKAASEIRKRAERLSANLVLPKPEKRDKRARPEAVSEAAELKRTLVTLDELIAGFAHNPVFRDVNIVDAELSAKARRDLDDIIELSGLLKKSCERMDKARQPH
jgi:hypothetical protein